MLIGFSVHVLSEFVSAERMILHYEQNRRDRAPTEPMIGKVRPWNASHCDGCQSFDPPRQARAGPWILTIAW